MKSASFPVGFYPLHPDVSMNFQMNRWYSWVGEPGMLDEMRAAAPRIVNYVDWKREFMALANTAKTQAHILRAGFYFRAADFFMRTNDPDRRRALAEFLHAMREVYGLNQLGSYLVPYVAEGTSSNSICPPCQRRRCTFRPWQWGTTCLRSMQLGACRLSMSFSGEPEWVSDC